MVKVWKQCVQGRSRDAEFIEYVTLRFLGHDDFLNTAISYQRTKRVFHARLLPISSVRHHISTAGRSSASVGRASGNRSISRGIVTASGSATAGATAASGGIKGSGSGMARGRVK